MFSDKDSKLVSTIVIPVTDITFTNGMYYVANVPANAEWVHFTLYYNIPFDKVVVTTSSSIYDIEPDWVKVEPFLMGAFETTLSNTAKYQTTAKNALPVNNMTFASAKTNAEARKLKLVNYTMRAYVTNLYIAKYGNRNSQAQCAYGSATTDKQIGNTALTGMKDTVNPTNKISGSWYEKLDGAGAVTYIDISNIKCMGYENFYGNRSEWLDGITTITNNANQSAGGNVVMKDGSIRKAIADSVGTIPAVANGKYMDITPVGFRTSNGASSTSKYCDDSNLFYPVAGDPAVGVVCSGEVNYWAGGIYYFNSTSLTSASTSISCRLAFDKQINVVTLATYNTLTSIA